MNFFMYLILVKSPAVCSWKKTEAETAKLFMFRFITSTFSEFPRYHKQQTRLPAIYNLPDAKQRVDSNRK